MSAPVDDAKLQELAGKVVGNVAGAMSVFMAYIGDPTAAYRAMAGATPMSATERR